MAEIKVHLHYPHSDKYEWETRMEYLDFDEERRKDVSSGNGFIIKSPKPIKDDIKDPEGIFSTRYGAQLQDMNAFGDRYKCNCGYLKQRINSGQICPICHTPVRFVDDNFSYTGWVVLSDKYYVIHGSLFMAISYFIGANALNNIIRINKKIDEDGVIVDSAKAPKGEPFYGIGMMEFHDRFDEIMDYYLSKTKSPAKLEYYRDIMRNRDKIFTHSIPIYTTLLRPISIEGGDFHFEDTNAIFKMIASFVAKINNDKNRMNNKTKMKNELLYDLQMKIKELFTEVGKILSGKRGSLRQIYGGRLINSPTSEQLLAA